MAVSKGSRLTPTATPPSGFPVREVGRGNYGMYFFGAGEAEREQKPVEIICIRRPVFAPDDEVYQNGGEFSVPTTR